MSYTTPPRFSHGDRTASAANFNIYSADIEYLYSVLADIFPAVTAAAGANAYLINSWRWLWYQTMPGQVAKLVDPSGANDDTNLPSADSAMTAFDLAGISWLTPGQLYYVTNCIFVAEDQNA